MATEFICKNREELNQKVSLRCAGQLSSAIDRNGRASIVIPGGTTPAPIFQKLSGYTLSWEDISVVPSDERWVPVDHAMSNQRLIEQNLLINHASSAQLISLKNAAETAAEGESITEANLNQAPRPYAVTVLGMGNDGHFASLFPGCPQIAEGLDPKQHKQCLAIDATGCPVAGDYTQRMSLTLSNLLSTELVLLLVTGQQKLDLLREAADKPVKLDNPVTALLAQNNVPVEIYWSE